MASASEILRYLLLSDRVRQPPDHFLIDHYAFEMSVLCVNCAFNAEAKAVLFGEKQVLP
jgi:hypothetical protein